MEPPNKGLFRGNIASLCFRLCVSLSLSIGRILFGGYDDYAIRVWDVIKVIYTSFEPKPKIINKGSIRRIRADRVGIFKVPGDCASVY